MSSNFDSIQWNLDHARTRVQEQAEMMVKALRDKADRVERDAKALLEDRDFTFAAETERAGWIVNDLNFLLPNLNPQDLVIRAAELERARKAAAELDN